MVNKVLCEKGIRSLQWGIFKIFCVKSNLTVCKVTFNCKLQKKIGQQDLLDAPVIFSVT